MKKPNILFFFPDQHRGDWLPYSESIYKGQLGMDALPIHMPNVQQFMEKGVTFTRAVTPSPLCAPARACVAGGLRYARCRVANNGDDYPLDQRTFYSVLKEAGYHVGGVGKFDLHKQTKWWGLDGWIDDLGKMGFTEGVDNAGKIDAINSGKETPKDPYMNYLYQRQLADVHIRDMKGRGKSTAPTPLPDEAYCDNWLSNNGMHMLRNFPADKPWFLVVNFTGPHAPFDVTKRMKQAWGNVRFPMPNQADERESQNLGLRQNYAAMLENIDRNIGLMMDEVRKRGEEENTLVVYASDHGDMLGDFGKYGKTKPERGSVHVPLVISGPGIRQGVYSDALVELQDLAQTFVEFADTSMPEAKDSLSLRPLLVNGVEHHRDLQLSALGDWKMLSDGKYKLITQAGKAPRLYHLHQDPWENHNVAEQFPDKVEQLISHLS